MQFEFATANRIIFGPGKSGEAGPIASSFGKRTLVVTGASRERISGFLASLNASGLELAICTIPHEPTLELIENGSQIGRELAVDSVIAVGGGSVIDAGKAIAAQITNPGDLLDYLEVIGKGLSLEHSPLPCIALPTTAGTGAEVTRNSVLTSKAHGVKASLRSPMMLPKAAIVDPELTWGLPKNITAWTGMDALTQLIEPFVSSRRNPLVDGICREGMKLAARSLPEVFYDGSNKKAREEMSMAALFGGLALANAGLGAVHGFAAPIGGKFEAPHGAVCAALLPHVMEANVITLRSSSADSEILARFEQVARILTGGPTAVAEDGIRWVRELSAKLQIPKLSSWGLAASDKSELAKLALQSSSMKANPVALDLIALEAILERAI